MEPGAPPGVAGETTERARRRTYLLFLAPTAVIFFIEGIFEADKLNHLLDDAIIVAVAVVAIGYYIATRKDTSQAGLSKANRFALVVAVIIVLAAILAFTQEYTDVMDFGDDPPTLILGVILTASGFVGGVGPTAGLTDSASVKDLLRRRAWAFLFVFALLVSADISLYDLGYNLGIAAALEGVFEAVIAVAALGLIAATWRSGIGSIRRTNNALAVLAGLLIVVSVYYGDPPVLFFGVAVLANRFL